MCWIWLSVAILLEVAATIFMKLSAGFTRTIPTISMFVLYGLSFVPLVITLKHLEVGAVYAIWSAVGTVLVTMIGILLFHESANMLKVVAIGLIVAGVVCLNLSSRTDAPETTAESRVPMRGDARLQQPSIAAATQGAMVSAAVITKSTATSR
jgi:small multidrug resistance pump